MAFIARQGVAFRNGETTFFSAGFNCYYLGFASEAVQRRILAAAAQLGANTLRVWGFLQASPHHQGFYRFVNKRVVANDDPEGLPQFDRLIALAEENNIRLIVPLANHWDDFGGVRGFLAASGHGSLPASEFYSDHEATSLYRQWCELLLTRKNQITGRHYCDESAVMAWELMNEPRCELRNGRHKLFAWVEESARFIKSLDHNHLLAVGDEGFFHRFTRWGRLRTRHLYSGQYGVDFDSFLRVSEIDFGTYHFYPETWNVPVGYGARWIQAHTQAGKRAGKPVLLEEFGVSDPDSRPTLYRGWARSITNSGGAGGLVWMLGTKQESFANYSDCYTLFIEHTSPSYQL